MELQGNKMLWACDFPSAPCIGRSPEREECYTYPGAIERNLNSNADQKSVRIDLLPQAPGQQGRLSAVSPGREP